MSKLKDKRPWAFDDNQTWTDFVTACLANDIKMRPVNAFYSDDEGGKSLPVQGHNCEVSQLYHKDEYFGCLFVMGHGKRGFTAYLEMQERSNPDRVHRLCAAAGYLAKPPKA